MVQPVSGQGRITSGQVHNNCRTFPRENTVAPAPEAVGALSGKKRRRKGAGPPRKRRRGEPGGLCQLNFDVLYMIFEYMYPMDLLNLARTNKYFRGILMQKSSMRLWKTALRRIEGLPECPIDLSEPEYTNLVFYICCHGCGKPAKTILWSIRRRYCPSCSVERLCYYDSCDEVIRQHNVLLSEWLTIGDYGGRWVDKNRMDSFVREYCSSSDKTQILNERRIHHQIICSHARECESWQQGKGRVQRYDLDVLRKERQESIFERLRQRGYEPEIIYFGDSLVKKSYKSVFKKFKPLMNDEWDQMRPAWVKIMDDFRSLRLEVAVHRPRRRLLVSEYNEYVTHPSPDSPTFAVLPHVADLARFSPFRDIIMAPEGARLGNKPFASAFAQLPALVGNWMQKLNSEIAALVTIPSCLSSDDAFGNRDRDEVSSCTMDLNKLNLACAVFYVGSTSAFAYPEVLSVSMRSEMGLPTNEVNLKTSSGKIGYVCREDHSQRVGSIHDRFGLKFLEEAPYIVRACGLDPNVATVNDMDRRNARLRCLHCITPFLVMNWKQAIWHARFYHCVEIDLEPLPDSTRWQRVSDEHVDSIQAVERSFQREFAPNETRCLLCRPCVGDSMLYDNAVRHLTLCHKVEKDEIEEGVHYKLIDMRDACVVEMVQAGEQVTFKGLQG